MADRMTEAPTREYRAVIWTKEPALAGQRVTVLAHSLEEAKKRLEEVHGAGTVFELDTLYPQQSGASVRAELVERLAAAVPDDLGHVELRDYKGLVAPWNNWEHVAAEGRRLSRALAASTLEGG